MRSPADASPARPRERKRTAWGRCGSLLLHRIGLAPITPCRSPGAQSPQLHQEVRANRRDFRQERAFDPDDPFLAPEIVKGAVEGRLPRGFGLKRLVDLPMAWPDQWRTLGLQEPAQA